MMANRAFWPRKKLRQSLSLPKQSSEYLRSQGISELLSNNVETLDAEGHMISSVAISKQGLRFLIVIE